MDARWGPERTDNHRTVFRLWAPDCESVELETENGLSIGMKPQENGWFRVEADATTGTRYRFRINDDLAVPDPASRRQEGGVHGWSVLIDTDAHDWQTADWIGRPWEETIIEEVHPGVLGGFAGVSDRLPQLAELGVTAIELMPIGAFSGTRNWGYDGVLPYAVAEPYGSPDALKALVDRAHALNIMVFLDVVYNHFGPDGNYLGAYASEFFDPDADTPWGGAVAVTKQPVRRYFIDNALMWLDEYRIDGLRFDAVHAIGDDEFLDTMAREIRAKLPDRHIHLMLENEGNDTERLQPGLYDAQWNDDFHNVLHVLLTGETEAYYRGLADNPTQKLARCLAEGFVYQGETPPGSDHARGKPSAGLNTTRFISFLQNHDQIGNRAMGERLSLLVGHARLQAATALLLLCPQIPMFFMGDTEGSRSPFLFFTDFHDELADAVRKGRRGEFAGFAAFADEEARERIPDPNDPVTFKQSRAEPGPQAEEWRGFYRDLLAIRRDIIVPRLKGTVGLGAEVMGDGAVAARWRMGDGAELAIAINLGAVAVRFPPTRGTVIFALGQAGKAASLRAEIIR